MEISRRDVFKWPLNVGCGAAGFLSALVVVPISWRRRWREAIRPRQMGPEVKILAKISKHMYSSDEVCTAGGWKLMKKKDKFAIFTRGTELLVAFQGTQLQGEGRWEDLKKDLFILFNMQEITLSNCLKDVFDTLKDFPAQKDIIVTGHSLGGMLAYMMAVSAEKFNEKRNIRGHIFNPGASWDMLKVLVNQRFLGFSLA